MAGRIVTLSVLLACITLVGLLFYQVIAPFLLPLFLAAILAILCRPAYLHVLRLVGNRNELAAALTTIAIMLILVTPVVIGTIVGATQISRLTQSESQDWDWSRGLDKLRADFLEPNLRKLEARYPDLIQTDDFLADMRSHGQAVVQSVAGRTFSWASSTLGSVLSLAVSGGMFLVAFYYFLADGPGLIAAAEALIPLPLEHQRRLEDRFAKVVRAVVTATFFAAFAQGLATAAALQVVGMGHFFVFLIAGSITAMIPLAGTWMVWGPCAAWLAYQGHTSAAIGLALFGIIVVGFLDNVIRTYVLNSNAQLHPLLAFVSVLGALEVMGLWGIFFGPIIASCLYALVQIFMTELQSFSTPPPGEPPIIAAAIVAPAPANPQVMTVSVTEPKPARGPAGKKKHRK